jgi:hypothetical protein
MEWLSSLGQSMMEITGWSLFTLAILAGLALDLVGLFGNWIIFAAVTLAWVFTGFEAFSWVTLVLLLLLAVIGEVLETGLAGYGAKKFGGSKGAMIPTIIGCLIGAVLGTPLFPIIGTIIGACMGAFVAATLYEYIVHERGVKSSMWTGTGAAIGKVGGLFAKLFCGFAMLAVAALTF